MVEVASLRMDENWLAAADRVATFPRAPSSPSRIAPVAAASPTLTSMAEACARSAVVEIVSLARIICSAATATSLMAAVFSKTERTTSLTLPAMSTISPSWSMRSDTPWMNDAAVASAGAGCGSGLARARFIADAPAHCLVTMTERD